MLSNLLRSLRDHRLGIVVLTALAPAIWGTTYLVTTELLPPGRPLLAAVLRALPAGLLLVAITRRLPRGIWWWRALLLGALNIGVFFALLFVAAYRLPGGVAATVGAVQPLIAAGLSAALLGDRLSARTAFAGIAGVAGVSLLVLRSEARLDAVGVGAALGGALVMAAGVVLAKRWASPAPLLATTGWQLVAGGLLLLPVALLVEGPPPAGLTAVNLAGYAYLSLIGAAVAYALWFRGIRALPPTAVSFLGLLSPVVATVIGVIVAGERLNALQAVGGAVVLAALVVAQRQRPGPRRTGTPRPDAAPRAKTASRPDAASRAKTASRPDAASRPSTAPRPDAASRAVTAPPDIVRTDTAPSRGTDHAYDRLRSSRPGGPPDRERGPVARA